MFLNSLFMILKLKILYVFSRKIQFFEKSLKKIFKSKNLDKYLVTLFVSWNIVQYVIFYFVMFGISLLSKNYLSQEEIVKIFIFFIFIFSLFSGFSIVKFVISPTEELLLSVSPLSSFQIFNYVWLINFVIYILPSYFYIFIIYLAIGNDFSFEGWVVLILYILTCILCSYLCTLLGSIISVNRIKKGFNFSVFLFNFFIGLLILSTSWWVSKSMLSWFSLKPNIIKLTEWKKLPSIFVEHLRTLLDLKEQFINFDVIVAKYILDQSLSIYFLITLGLIFVFGGLVAKTYAGYWYRTEWRSITRNKKDWLDKIHFIFLKVKKNQLEETQINFLFNNREQLSQNISYFFFHYTNYMFIGISIAVSSLTNFEDNFFLRVIGIIFIFNAISRDSFESGSTLFPGIFNFDADGKSLYMYRLSGTDFKKLYNVKIKIQRLFGLPEFIIMFTICSLIFNLSYIELIFAMVISLVNFMGIPHLKILPSFGSPHTDFQHYTEIEEFEERELWEENADSKIVYFLTLFIYFIPISLYLFGFNLLSTYILSSVILILTSMILSSIFKIIKNKFSAKISKMDFL